jgi:hypothetical protein
MIGVICSLMQFGFLSGIKPRAYLKGAWISSAIAGLAASGAMDIITWLTPPIEYSIAAEGHMISFTLPMMIMTSIFVYGIGTSIVLFLLNKNKGLEHEK